MFGVVVNASAILIGGVIGLIVKKGIPERFSKVIMIGIGLSIMYIGISGSLQGENLIVLVLAIVLGVATGTALRIDERLTSLGQILEKRFVSSKGGEADPGDVEGAGGIEADGDNAGESDAGGEQKQSFTKGFVNASILFCVGAMAIVGSFESGFTGDHSIIFAKSTIDFVAAIMLTVTLGFGVMFAAVSVFLYQGALVLLAQLLQPVLYDPVTIAEMSSVGSIIIIALGLNMLGVTKIKIADFLPAVVFAPIFSIIAEWL